VTSFSSKSELALNLSLGGTHLTFMGYIGPANALDVARLLVGDCRGSWLRPI